MAAVVKLGPRDRLTPLRPVFHPLARTAKRLQDRQFQKRRVAVARSMAANSQTLSTERPFNPHDFPVPDATSPPLPIFYTFFFPPAPRQSQSPMPATDQACRSLATSSSSFFSFLFNPSLHLYDLPIIPLFSFLRTESASTLAARRNPYSANG